MSALQISYPAELSQMLQRPPEVLEQQMKFMLAAKLYELGDIGSGYAAKLAGMERVEFLEQLGSIQVSVLNYGLDELEREIEGAHQRADVALASQ